MDKIELFEIVYKAKKFSVNRVTSLRNCTVKAGFKKLAKLMAKEYKIEEIRINKMNINDYIKEYCTE